MGSSFDQVGIFGRQIDDIQGIFDIIKGRDEHDMTTFEIKEFLPLNNKKQYTFGLPKQFLGEGSDSRIIKQIQDVCEELKKNGHTIKEIDIQTLQEVVAIYYTLIPAEVATNLARFDGIRYGLQEDSFDHSSLHEYLTQVRKLGL
jgi:aspartyl-tRNA(Asn)/glutamyl-tRNA(Gln) amidotransferase subunit A